MSHLGLTIFDTTRELNTKLANYIVLYPCLDTTRMQIANPRISTLATLIF
jgi:hypothetical protein